MNIIFTLVIILFGLIQSNVFDPDGYYFPVNKTIISGFQFEYFNINTVEYSKNGKHDYEHSKILKPEIDVSLLHQPKRFSATNILVSKDTLVFEIELSKDKTMIFNGKFIDKRGEYWNQNDIKAKQTIIVSGVFNVVQQNKIIESKKVKFTYWEGD